MQNQSLKGFESHVKDAIFYYTGKNQMGERVKSNVEPSKMLKRNRMTGCVQGGVVEGVWKQCIVYN